MAEPIVSWYCHSCGKTHKHTAQERDDHRDYLRRMEAAAIDEARRKREAGLVP